MYPGSSPDARAKPLGPMRVGALRGVTSDRPHKEKTVLPIRRYLEGHASFEPKAIDIMSKALEEACEALHINGEIRDREVVATRIIDLARNGIIDPKALSKRVVAEVKAMRSL